MALASPVAWPERMYGLYFSGGVCASMSRWMKVAQWKALAGVSVHQTARTVKARPLSAVPVMVEYEPSRLVVMDLNAAIL